MYEKPVVTKATRSARRHVAKQIPTRFAERCSSVAGLRGVSVERIFRAKIEFSAWNTQRRVMRKLSLRDHNKRDVFLDANLVGGGSRMHTWWSKPPRLHSSTIPGAVPHKELSPTSNKAAPSNCSLSNDVGNFLVLKTIWLAIMRCVAT